MEPQRHEICFENGLMIRYDKGSDAFEWKTVNDRIRGIDKFFIPFCAAVAVGSMSFSVAAIASIDDVAQNILITAVTGIFALVGKKAYRDESRKYNAWYNLHGVNGAKAFDPSYLMPSLDCTRAPLDRDGFVDPPKLLYISKN